MLCLESLSELPKPEREPSPERGEHEDAPPSRSHSEPAWGHAVSAARQALVRALGRISPNEQQRLFVLTLVVGALCGLVAVSFHLSIRWTEAQLIERALGVGGIFAQIGMVVVPTVGALVVGVALTYLPAARGSGIPQVKAFYALSGRKVRLRLRDAAAKFVLASVAIGTGSSLGREGPTVQICSTVASGIGRAFALSPSNQRRLVPVGAAAGIAAAFNAPIAAVTFVIEELLGALDATVLGGVVVAAALAAVVERSILGEHPVFTVSHDYGLAHPSSLVIFALMGVTAGVAGTLFSRGLLGLRAWFSGASRIPLFARPALGGFVTGLIALALFHAAGAGGVLGGGYATIGAALGGQLALGTMAALFLAKAGATTMSYSSGGAGGIFAPTLFIGSMLGGLFGGLDTILLGHTDTQLGAFALVGMGAFFAGVIRAPMTSILIIFEMTGSYRLVLPLMIANTVAYLVARRLRSVGIYEALLEQDGIPMPHGISSGPTLSRLSVGGAMTREVQVLSPTMTVGQALEIVGRTGFASFPVVDEHGRLVGVVSEGALMRFAASGKSEDRLGLHAREREYLKTDHSLRHALSTMNRLSVRQMTVVDNRDPSRLAGILTMSDVMRAAVAAEPAAESRATLTPTPGAGW